MFIRQCMPASYKVLPWDSVKRWIVVKEQDGKVEGLLVQLNGLGKGNHLCGCRYHECHRWIQSQKLPACKHIKLVLEKVFELADRPGPSVVE